MRNDAVDKGIRELAAADAGDVVADGDQIFCRVAIEDDRVARHGSGLEQARADFLSAQGARRIGGERIRACGDDIPKPRVEV